MQKLSNSQLFQTFINIFGVFALAKTLSLILWWFLPNDGVEFIKETNYKPSYQRVDFKNMLTPSTQTIKQAATGASQYDKSINITNMILKGLYGKGRHGMAIVALKSSANKTTVLSVGETFSGYKLEEIYIDRVVFVKEAKEYTLQMAKSKTPSTSFIKEIEQIEGTTQVSRKDINDYVQQRKDIWKDITIEPVNEEGEIKGFEVKSINKNSQIATLGLEVGDRIVIANNVELTSMKAVLDLYKDIKTIQTLQLVVLRDGQEEELIFDIN